MPRDGAVKPRVILPDPKYHSREVAKLVNKIMHGGQRSKAQGIVYRAFEKVEERANKDALEVFNRALQEVIPQVEVRSRRVGGANYQIPIEVRPERGLMLALLWLVDAARSRKGKAMFEKLAAEILDASKGEGSAAKKKADTHRMAEANRAFAHYRW